MIGTPYDFIDFSYQTKTFAIKKENFEYIDLIEFFIDFP
jgi:hypothetical protein